MLAINCVCWVKGLEGKGKLAYLYLRGLLSIRSVEVGVRDFVLMRKKENCWLWVEGEVELGFVPIGAFIAFL